MAAAPSHSGEYPTAAPQEALSGHLLAVVVLSAVFLYFSLARSVVPGVNEPHYLCKARHYWQPDWCRGDLFLESANPHAVFYQAFGGLTTRMSLNQAALLIRVGQSLLLAVGWLALGTRCLGDLRRAIIAAALFLLLHATGTLSGEWMVGGAESKVWAYGFLMLSAAWGLDRSWYRCAIAGGLAVSMHPVIGCWGAIIAGLGWGLSVAFRSVKERPFAERKATISHYDGHPCPSFSVIAIALALFILTSLPGLIPAVQSLSAPSAKIASEADYLQVAVRLPHHLDPLTFSVRAWRDYGLLLLLLVVIRARQIHRTPAQSQLEFWLLAALLIALGGVIAAWGPRPLKAMPWWELRVKVLKLYPFRLADMLVPLTVSFTLAAALWHWSEERLTAWRRPAAIAAVVLVAMLIAFRIPAQDNTLDHQTLAVQRDWRAACQWIREQTPKEAILYATNDNWSLRWYAERPEYFSFKDCPQDAASIVEWNRRNWVIYQWKVRAFSDGSVSAEELSELRKETGITHLVCGRFGPVKQTPVFSSANLSVYELP